MSKEKIEEAIAAYCHSWLPEGLRHVRDMAEEIATAIKAPSPSTISSPAPSGRETAHELGDGSVSDGVVGDVRSFLDELRDHFDGQVDINGNGGPNFAMKVMSLCDVTDNVINRLIRSREAARDECDRQASALAGARDAALEEAIKELIRQGWDGAHTSPVGIVRALKSTAEKKG